jgi:flagellar FliJ protein
MGFTFRFETLLKVKKIKENIAQQAFSKSQRHYLNLENLKNIQSATKNDMEKELRKKMVRGLTALQIKQYHDYISFLEEKIKQLGKNLALAQKQLDERREEMLGAKREHKAMKRLKEIEHARYITDQNKSQMRFIDEIAVLRHGANR